MKKLGTKAVAGGAAGICWLCHTDVKSPLQLYTRPQMSPCPYPAMSGQNITIYDHVPDTERKKERARERERQKGGGGD